MGRLILAPQYPTKLRYQEWWWTEFPKRFAFYYDEVIVLGKALQDGRRSIGFEFAPMSAAIQFETKQINEYMNLQLREDDTLLLCDLSYPGLFTHVLLHKRPSKCFAICHATSKNRYDYFARDRSIKYPVEKAIAKLFNGIFVGSKYHRNKLALWPNAIVTHLPFASMSGTSNVKLYNIVSVARPGKQKRNAHLERLIERVFNCKIITPECQTWEEYYDFLSKSKIMLITSNEETFGYQVLDAIANGCVPIAPNRFSYPELLSKIYLYNNTTELIDMIDEVLNHGGPKPYLLIHDTFFTKVSHIMQNE